MTDAMSNGSSNAGPTGTARRLDDAPWLRSAPLATVIKSLSMGAGEVRVVGGAVRNALLGHPIADIDLATILLPDEVMKRARLSGLGVHPTGIDHGTVTIVSDNVPFEVTTLRRDVETDGRRAVVEFSTDWREDAGRRDFTINAFYATPEGEIFDYFDGLADLEAGRVRFIGDPHARIREDYLRILRFFRFNAQYGRGEIEPQGLAACVALKDGLGRLSAERIGNEMLKLIAAPRAAEVVDRHGGDGDPAGDPRVRPRFPSASSGFSRSKKPMDLPPTAGRASRRSRSMDPRTCRCWLRVCASRMPIRMSWRVPHPSMPASIPQRPNPRRGHGFTSAAAEAFRRAALVAWARSNAPVDDLNRKNRVTLPERWTAPQMPVRGADVLSLGVKEGASVGRILERFEAWWIAAGFPDDPALHKKKLAALAGDGY